MKLTHHSILLCAAVLLLTSACSVPSRQTITPSTQPQSPSETPSASPVANPAIVNWQNILGDTALPSDWRVFPCDSASHLCVEFQGKSVGSVEINSFPLEQIEFNVQMSQGHDRSAAANAQSSEAMQKALQTWVENHYDTIKRDRQTGLGEQVIFSSQTPKVVAIGELQGLRYEFTTTRKPDQVFERSIGYVASDGKMLYVITTSVPHSDAGGTFTTNATLQQFEPHLQSIIAHLKLRNRTPLNSNSIQ